MPTVSVSNTVSGTVPRDNKNQSLTVAKKGASNPNRSDQYEVLRKRENNNNNNYNINNNNYNINNNNKRKAHEVPLRRSARLKKRREEMSRVLPASDLVSQTGPSQYRGRVDGGRHIPSHSSGPIISNVPSLPFTAGAASVVQPLPPVSAQTPLPKPARVQPPVPPPKTYCESGKVECITQQDLEKSGKKHQKNMRVHKSFTCLLCNLKCDSEAKYQSHLTGKKHLSKLRPHFTCALCDFNCASQVAYESHLTGKQHLSKLRVSFTCRLCDVKCETQFAYESHLAGKFHLSRLSDGYKCEVCDVKFDGKGNYKNHLNGRNHLCKAKLVHDTQVLFGGLQSVSEGHMGVQILHPLDINALSNAINARVQQGENSPQVLLAQLMMTVLSKTPAPATAQVTGTMADQIPAPTSLAGPSDEPQLLQTQVSEITAHVEMENPSEETKTEPISVQLGSNAQPGSSFSTQIEGGGCEAKQTGVKFPQDGSSVIPAADSGAANDQIPSECEAPNS